MRRLYPLTTPFVSRLRKSDRYLARDVLMPAETEAVIAPWISETSLARISAAHPWSDLASELAILDQKTVSHAAVVRFFHGPGIVGPDGYVTKHSRERLSPTFTINALTKKMTEKPTVNYVNDKAIARYFGHWLTDGVPQTALAERRVLLS